MIALALMAATAGAPVILTDRATIRLPARSIRLGDVVARRAGLGATAEIAIARVPAGTERLTLSRRAVATLVRRAVPGLSVMNGDGGRIVFRAAPDVRKPAPSKIFVRPTPPVAQGDAMTLKVQAGPVTIERPVTALQPGHAGRRVFVRDATGHVFAVTLAEMAR